MGLHRSNWRPIQSEQRLIKYTKKSLDLYPNICYGVTMIEQYATPESIVATAFWRKVAIRSQFECWEWLGAKDSRRYNYGRFNDGEKVLYAHIVAYKLTYGNFPKRFENGRLVVVRHLCGNYTCVNPNHLSLGTQSDNGKDIYNVRSFNKEQKILLMK